MTLVFDTLCVTIERGALSDFLRDRHVGALAEADDFVEPLLRNRTVTL